MSAPTSSANGWLAVYLVVLAFQRIGELVLSARHARALRVRGGREHGAAHFPRIVLVHALFPLLLGFEVIGLGTQPGPAWPAWLALWLTAQALRYAAVLALGERWTVRIWVLPGEPLVTRGVYRWLRHPNYVAVVLERFLAAGDIGAGDLALLSALGPGFSAEYVLLRGEAA